MKLNHLLIVAIIISIVAVSCGTDNELTPNPTFDPEASDQTTNNNGGGDDGNDDGGDDDGGDDNDTTSTTPYFRAGIDGVTSGFPIKSFQTTGTSVEIKGEKTSNSEAITFTLNTSITEGDTIFLGRTNDYVEYLGSNFLVYVSDEGYIVFNRVTNLFVEAKFEFDASAATDTSIKVDITNGEFLINK
jgi:hypothetical protein